jgi:hypothetical protein
VTDQRGTDRKRSDGRQDPSSETRDLFALLRLRAMTGRDTARVVMRASRSCINKRSRQIPMNARIRWVLRLDDRIFRRLYWE